ncbi:MAG: hypothetical protein M1490_02205, partial [Candidatus Bathyarchaeota archaeon]|nr:hypothetical protein [Candidatus Bathyarchaeota archaeon]
CMASLAAKHDIGIRLLFSHSSDHYIRVYAQIEYVKASLLVQLLFFMGTIKLARVKQNILFHSPSPHKRVKRKLLKKTSAKTVFLHQA